MLTSVSIHRIALATLSVAAPGCDISIPDLEAIGADVELGEVGPTIDEILENENCGDLTEADFDCGGDPVGIWEIVRSCPALGGYDPLNNTCAELVVDGQGEAIGTVEFRGDGTYQIEIEERTLEISFVFPLACFGGATEPCNGSNFFGTCFILDANCGCDVVRQRGALDETGTWVRFFSDVEFTAGDGTEVAGKLCREGDIMRFVRFSPIEDEVDWGYLMRRVDDLDD